MRKTLLRFLAMGLLLIAAGCGRSGGPAAPQVATSGTVIVEPGAGAAPYLALVRSARRSIDVNSYLLTDRDLVGVLVRRARAGVAVRVIVAGNPDDDQQAVAGEQAAFAGTRVLFKLAPARFEGHYVFDHAKYIVVDSHRAILGSSNLDYYGLGGGNREYDFETTDPAAVARLAAIFDADWNGRPLRLDHPGPLVISPGAEGALVNLIRGAKRTLDIEAEELGNDRPVLDAVAAAARRGVRVAVVLPAHISADNRQNARDMVRAGAAVRFLARPYPHAKLIIADDRTFVGSQNISVSSLDKNREVGIVVAGGPVAVFERDFKAARP